MKKLPAACMLLGKVIVIAFVCFNFFSPSCSDTTGRRATMGVWTSTNTQLSGANAAATK